MALEDLKIRVYAFDAYGLNKYKNIFGIQKNVMKYSLDEILDRSIGTLENIDDVSVAIFIHTLSAGIYVVLRRYISDGFYNVYKEDLELKESDKGHIVIKVLNFEDEMSIIGQIDAMYDLRRYGLIIESRNGNWVIVRE